MLRFAVRRTVALFFVLLVLVVLVFLISRYGGGDPVRGYLGANASAAAVAQARVDLGLDRPVWAQFADYLGRLVRGDFGISLSSKRPVADDLSSRIPATAELAIWTVFVTVLLGVLLARVSSMRGRFAGVLRFVLFSGASAPSFLLATGGILLFFVHLRILPVAGRTAYGPSEGLSGMYVLDGLLTGNLAYAGDAVLHLLLPAVAAGLGPGLALARVLADGLTSSLRSGYARTARSLGETESKVLWRHSLRNAASPALSLLGVQLGMMLSSLVVVEQIFSWNGLGQYLVRAISGADTNVVATVSLILGACYVVLNALVDLALAAVDPRVRL
ncbi:ABC transporter permease [Actinoplanes derwentensis]|uniref:Peptide/nickel transport system permease protein n=1 Tax=Actinoplanes derwentensis TaxID=113562 RepID=A0A1H1UR40_9ACTN|nr:ABC transporter permease [Actinoplanes derwentensis]GID88144.1 putative oligopeptide ABC transporter, permease protein [Actinoplanes derwentensis]SDS75024.1 peptide/nickel transport system permease protein [Actinoplanes derwentensis]